MKRHGSANGASTRERLVPQREDLRKILRAYPVIPALRDESDLAAAAAAPSQVIYLMNARLSSLDVSIHALHTVGKEVIVNLDLCSGLARDAEAVEYLASSGAAGIISTHTDVLAAASSRGLYAIQRTFLIDSESMNSTIRSLKRFVPHALELLPAPVAPRILPALRERFPQVAAIGGGLIGSLQEADGLIRQGMDAVSVSNPELWSVHPG
jgi:glycerol uptake operon antiterminator